MAMMFKSEVIGGEGTGDNATRAWRLFGTSDLPERSKLRISMCNCDGGHDSEESAKMCDVAVRTIATLFPNGEEPPRQPEEGHGPQQQPPLKPGQQRVPLVNIYHLAARAAHEVGRAYCEHIGDPVNPPWDDAAEEQKASMVEGVLSLVKHPDATPAQMHTLWMAHKMADGWSYSETKDAEAKAHPCLVPYSKLSPEQKFKDALFQAVVRGVVPPQEQMK